MTTFLTYYKTDNSKRKKQLQFLHQNMEYKDISKKWAQQNDQIREMCQPCPLSDFQLDKQQRTPAVQFRILSFMTQTQFHVDKLYKNPGQFQFNRHEQIMTFDPTRIILAEDSDKDDPENYINANLIDIQGKKMIATQGPKPNTFENFWKMVQKYNVGAIFMLCAQRQKKQPKCDVYWKKCMTQGEKSTKNYQISLILQQPVMLPTKNGGVRASTITRRIINVKNTLNNFDRNVTQYHLLKWTDGDKPTQQIQEELDYLISKNIELLQQGVVTLAHCSAGVGRTGTFIAMTQLKMQLTHSDKVCIFENVRKLRQQRWGMVYTQQQYLYLYDFVLRQLKKLGGGDTNTFSDQEA